MTCKSRKSTLLIPNSLHYICVDKRKRRDDLTSGFNIGTNYSLSAEFNELTGFTEEDVRQMLNYYATTCEFHHTTDELAVLMKP